MQISKSQFISHWMEENWPKFVAEGLDDGHGRLITVADALELTACEHKAVNEAFKLGACKTYDAIEVIAKAYLIDVVVDAYWDEHLYRLALLKSEQENAAAELAFESHDMKESAK